MATLAQHPNMTFTNAFNAVAAANGWARGSDRYKSEWFRALQLEWQRLIGASLAGLAGWQQLCRDCGVAAADVPGSTTQCKLVSMEILRPDVLPST